MKQGAFVYAPEVAKFTYGPDHPFDPGRAVKVYELCERYGLLDPEEVTVCSPRSITQQDLELAHSPGYLSALRKADGGRDIEDPYKWGLGTVDCPIFEGVFRYSEISAGASVAAFHEVAAEGARCGFNPSGGFHHAFYNHAEGFCYINDVVIVLKKLLALGRRPAFVDIDAHQPNAVIDAFWKDSRVLVLSFHETPRTLYPFKGTVEEMGEEAGKGYTVNIPLEPGADDEVFTSLFNDITPPLLEAFSPDILVLEAGMDMLKTDPLAHLRLSSNALLQAVQTLLKGALPVIAVGGGGYDARNTVRGWTRLWAQLIGKEPEDAFAGAVGGMMFGPEAEAGTLTDPPQIANSAGKSEAQRKAEGVRDFVKSQILPLLKGS